jgi:hypothetical protein
LVLADTCSRVRDLLLLLLARLLRMRVQGSRCFKHCPNAIMVGACVLQGVLTTVGVYSTTADPGPGGCRQ